MRTTFSLLLFLLLTSPCLAAGGSNLGEYGKNFKPAVLTGRVTMDGAPVSGAAVSTIAGHSTRTDSNGDYTLHIDAPGVYTVIFKSSARTETRTAEVFLGRTTVLDISSSTSKYTVKPDKGTIGTAITVAGEGFGTRRRSVFIGEVKCKVLGWADSSIQVVLIKAGTAGTYNVKIVPALKGSSPILLENAFSVMEPRIDSISPQEGKVGDSIEIQGAYAGTVKLKVSLQYIQGMKTIKKSCKVLSQNMNPETGESQVVFQVPKGTPAGQASVIVTNAVGSAIKENGLTIK